MLHHFSAVCAASLNDCIALFSVIGSSADRHQSSLTAADVLQPDAHRWFGRDFNRGVDDIHFGAWGAWLKSVLISSSRRRIQPELTACQCRNQRSYREANKRRHRPQTNRMMAHWVIRSSRNYRRHSIPCALYRARMFAVGVQVGLHACQKRWSPLSVSACHHLMTNADGIYGYRIFSRRIIIESSSAMLITMPSRGASGSRVCTGSLTRYPRAVRKDQRRG